MMLASRWMSVIFGSLLFLAIMKVAATDACAFYCFVSPGMKGTFEIDSFRNLSCTHFVYGFSRIRPDMSLRGVTARDNLEVTSPGNLRKFLGLRNTHPNSTLLLGIHLLSHDVLHDIRQIRETSKNLVDIVRRNYKDTPKQEQALSMQPSSLPLFRRTLAISSRWMWRVADKLNELVDYVDHVYIVMEELPSSEDKYSVSHLDPLMPSDSIPLEDTISGCIDTMLSKGVPAEKIIVGLSSGGRTYKVHHPESTLHGEIAVKPHMRQGLQDICQYSKLSFDSNAACAVILQGKTNWTSSNFPNEQSLGKKIKWIAQEGLGGVGIFSPQFDDPMGKCELGPYPSHNLIGKMLKCRVRNHPRRHRSAQCTRLCYVDNDAEQFNPWSLLPHWCSHFVIGPVDIQLSDNVEISTRVKNLINRIQEWIRNSDDNKSRIVLSIGAQQTNDIWRVEVGTPIKRKNLINNINNVVNALNASGVEISWTFEPLDAFMDSSLLSQFLVDLNTVLPKSIQLLFSVNSDSSINSRYNVNVINSTTDLIILHTHRLHSSRQPFTGHHSPMFTGPGLRNDQISAETFVKDWISRGVPREKLILSVTTVPTVYALKEVFDNDTDTNVFGLPAIPVPFTRQIPSQTKVCETAKSNNSRVYWIEESGVPVLLHNSELIAFENEKSAKIKAAIWSSINNLGGLAIHGLSQDNPEGDCTGRPYPILQSIVDTQVCTICATVNESKASKCSSSFRTVCNYRLPELEEVQRLDPTGIPFERCDEVVVEHAVIDANLSIGFVSEEQHIVAKQLIRFRSRTKSMIMSLRCGMGRDEFASLMQSRAKRLKMASSIRSFVDDFSLTGVELRCADMVSKLTKLRFAYFLRLLKKEMRNHKDNECEKTISIRLSAWHTNLRETYDVTVLNSLHHVVLEPFSVPLLSDAAFVHSPLFPVDITQKSITSIDSAIRNWERAGLMLSKILLQIPSYGMEQSLVNSTDIGIGRPTEKQYAIIGQEELTKQIYELINSLEQDCGVAWVDEIFLYSHFHMRYALREGLAGVGLMSLNEDDHMGTCGSGVFPILRSISVKCY
ncbi:glycosyl hydrolase, family 18 [Dictyocaulus viviparus]|uniref:Glycosyl hydrolase, family 18 n=1 Tax=Dictyocaulus viviparus TaxID=29172 RepID=A0A0D8XJT1_DICVI|nr:glycosyl hydrolase, family 18 [Dictyocaulus viviparus]